MIVIIMKINNLCVGFVQMLGVERASLIVKVMPIVILTVSILVMIVLASKESSKKYLITLGLIMLVIYGILIGLLGKFAVVLIILYLLDLSLVQNVVDIINWQQITAWGGMPISMAIYKAREKIIKEYGNGINCDKINFYEYISYKDVIKLVEAEKDKMPDFWLKAFLDCKYSYRARQVMKMKGND